MAAKKVAVLPLTEEEYIAAFNTFSSNTTQYGFMLEMIKPVVESFNGKHIDLMSIGAGTGCFENDLVTKMGLDVSYFHVVEPSEDHREQLKQKVISWGYTKLAVDKSYFTENYETEHKFDLILMPHCLYHMDNIDLVILKAISLLKAQGKIVIFVHSETGADSELFFKAMEHMEYISRPLADEGVTRKSICEILAKNSIHYTTSREGSCATDVTQFIKRQKASTTNDAVSFFIQTRFEKLPQELRKELYELVKERVVHTDEDTFMLPHPTVMIIINSQQNNYFEKHSRIPSGTF